MRLDEKVAWYQKKIGTYDKQQWEKTIEQKILSGITHLPLKDTKLKTELIDVDLVRGSTFPKAKSKLSMLTVFYLAVLRLIFLPLYAKWWVKQTSPRLFMLLLSMYLILMTNLGIYSYNVNKSNTTEVEHIVSLSEFIIPIALSLLLSVIHSQIVATASINTTCHKIKKCRAHTSVKKRERVRRRKRTRTISTNSEDGIITTGIDRTKSFLKKTSSINIVNNSINNISDIDQNDNNCDRNNLMTEKAILNNGNENCSKSKEKEELNEPPIASAPIDLDRKCSSTSSVEMEAGSSGIRKRSVNWKMPIKNENDDKDHVIDDDGFESLNGKSSGGEEMSPRTTQKYVKKLPYMNNWVKEIHYDKSDSDTDTLKPSQKLLAPEANSKKDKKLRDSTDTDGEDDDFEMHDEKIATAKLLDETASGTDRNFVISNSDDCSYSSDINHSDTQNEQSDDEFELDEAPTIILNPSCGLDRVSCTIWEAREAKKAEMSVLDISSAIIERVEAMPETCDYVYIGVFLSILLSLIPAFCRLCEATVDSTNATELNFLDMPVILLEKASFSCITILRFAFGGTNWEKTVLILGFILRLCLTYLVFFLLAVAERTFKQRFLYAKLFSHITSSRRAQKSGIPHFRLNKVRNIKTWLCVRSYLKRRGPQNSVDVIVSAAFIITLLLLAFLSVEWLKDSVHLHSQSNLEALVWSCAFGAFLLRFMTLGTKINKKYKSISVLITEQINLYVQIEQKPNKKEELMISNNVLKLAADLLKELESPFKVSGLSANPYLYTTVKVVILSALSGVLSEMLGFKLKLHKIKIK